MLIRICIFVLIICCKIVSGSDDLRCVVSTIKKTEINKVSKTICNLPVEAVISTAMNLSNPKNDKVTEFNIYDATDVQLLPQAINKNFPNLHLIYATGTSIKSVSMKNFQGLRKLNKIFIIYCSLNVLDEDSFDDLESLVELNLHNNKIFSLPPKIFSKLLKITKINVGNNQITQVDAETFKNNINLKSLSLIGNSLKSLEPGLLISLKELTWFKAASNQISNLNSTLFENCMKLKVVTIKGNRITSIPVTLFSNSLQLGNFSLSQNPITSIDFSIFAKHKSLDSIFVTDTKLERILNIDQLTFSRRFEIGRNESCITGVYNKKTLAQLRKDVKSKCKVV